MCLTDIPGIVGDVEPFSTTFAAGRARSSIRGITKLVILQSLLLSTAFQIYCHSASTAAGRDEAFQSVDVGAEFSHALIHGSFWAQIGICFIRSRKLSKYFSLLVRESGRHGGRSVVVGLSQSN